jgi:hypothetical protein
VTDEQEVKRAIEQRERRPLSRAGQRRAFGDFVATLDVRGRERPQRTRHLRKCEVAEVPVFQVCDPGGEFVSQTARSYIAEVYVAVSGLLSDEPAEFLSVL